MKILILGSSYTLGSYKIVNGEEQWYSHTSWYDRLADEHELDVYCGRGLGYISYVDVLESVKLNDYDCCIIQECHEPKFQFTFDEKYNKHESTNIKKYVLDDDTIIFSRAINNRPGFQEQLERNYNIKFDNSVIDYLTKLGENTSILNVVKSSACMVNQLLRDHGIPGYIVCFQDKELFRFQNTHNRYLDMPTFRDLLDDNKNYVNIIEDTKSQLHLTEDGNKMIADVVISAFKEIINV